MTNNKTLIIIGAGIAGLATGCYARMNDYDVQVFEMHDKPGGMCTSWQRKGYTFDYCIHNLAGTSPKSDLRQIWDELGAFNGIEIINRDEFVCIEGPSGERFHWYTNLERMEKHLKEIAPEDAAVIGELISAARKFVGADLFAIQLGGFWRMMKVIARLPAVKRWSNITMSQFAERFKNPFLRRAFVHAQYDIPGDEVPMMAPLLFMAGLESGDLGWPAGGSLAFSKRIEQRLRELGGKVHFRSKVEKILVENDRAVGVRLADGSEHRADRIISAADGYGTIYSMLDGRYLTEAIQKYYAGFGDYLPFGLIIFLGLEGDLSQQPHAQTLLFDEPLDLGGIQQDSLHLVTFGSDTSLVSKGKSILKIEAQARYPYWKEKRDSDLKSYQNQKKLIAEAVIDRISPRFPGLKERIEIMDVSTPPTAERYTGNRYGCQAGPPKENADEIQRKGLSKTLPGLDRFYHVGQWSTATLGVSSAAVMGRNLVRELCKQDGKRFVTTM